MEPPLATRNPAVLKAMLGNAKGVIIFAGAGMSVEFGIPTYWTGSHAHYADQKSIYGYTALEHASGVLWESDPIMQERYHEERIKAIDEAFAQAPKDNSYTILRNFLDERKISHFAVTSNIDGAFAHFGYAPESIYEVHGSGRFAQCLAEPIEHGIFQDSPGHLCLTCGYKSRPNTLFFDDFAFNPQREQSQCMSYFDFLDTDLTGYVILEIGVGNTVPRIRDLATRLHYEEGLSYLHVNTMVDAGSQFSQMAATTNRGKINGRPEAWLTLSSKDAMLSLG